MIIFEPIILSKIDRFCRTLRTHRDDNQRWISPLDMAHQFKARFIMGLFIWSVKRTVETILTEIVGYLVFDSLTAGALRMFRQNSATLITWWRRFLARGRGRRRLFRGRLHT
ncbi:hypothetical protein F5B21DRAFT_344820 [Xylaria acuta]|nr:hypothetical protein F5B21DRAFT_344820 [Xylaria acuta]